MIEAIENHVFPELEKLELDDFDEVVPEKDQDIIDVNANFSSLLPLNKIARRIKLNYVITNWLLPPSALKIAECLGLCIDMKIIMAINKAASTMALDFSKYDIQNIPSFPEVCKVIALMFCRPITGSHQLNKIIFSKTDILPDNEKQIAVWLNMILDKVMVFDASKISISNSLLQMLTITSRPNLRELCIQGSQFNLSSLTRFLSKMTELETLKLQNIKLENDECNFNEIITNICSKFNLVFLK